MKSIDTKSEWNAISFTSKQIQIREQASIGGNADIIGNGGLLLSKRNSNLPFWKTNQFTAKGQWLSQWQQQASTKLTISWVVYGQNQQMQQGWTKFSGNPVISDYAWKHVTQSTLQLPINYSAQPNDPSLVRGTGEYANQWLLFFNIGGWAIKGWGVAVADSLAPLQQGHNPFTLVNPFPLTKATGGYNAPNDWLYVNGIWYAPDESRDHISRMWTSNNLKHWTLQGPIQGINGHDPGMVWDGEYFYLFNEDKNKITVVHANDPLGQWSAPPTNKGTAGIAVDVGEHTGDADIAFFNNRWHMFMDDGEHLHYSIAYAVTTAEAFPYGWQVQNKIFGPYSEQKNQAWDDDNLSGNQFGTGDADVVLDNQTLYMVYERPIGIAFKNLDLLDATEQQVLIRVEYHDQNNVLVTSDWTSVAVGKTTISLKKLGLSNNAKRWRLALMLHSDNAEESPLIESLLLV